MAFGLRKGVFVTEVEYGMALLDEDSGQYFTLNPTGALIVQTLLAGGSTAQAAEELTTRYAVDAASASRDVDELVAELRAARLLAD